MSGFEMYDIKNDVSSTAENTSFQQGVTGQVLPWIFFLFKYTQPLWSKECEDTFVSYLCPFSLPSHRDGEKDLQGVVFPESVIDSILLLLSHSFMLNWLLALLLQGSHYFEMCFGQTLYLAQHVCLIHTITAGQQLWSGQEMWQGSHKTICQILFLILSLLPFRGVSNRQDLRHEVWVCSNTKGISSYLLLSYSRVTGAGKNSIEDYGPND